MSGSGHGEKNSRRAYLVRIAPINGIRNCCQAGWIAPTTFADERRIAAERVIQRMSASWSRLLPRADSRNSTLCGSSSSVISMTGVDPNRKQTGLLLSTSTVLRGIPRSERAVPIRAKFLALREVDGRAPAEQPLDAEYDANPLGDAARGQVRRSES